MPYYLNNKCFIANTWQTAYEARNNTAALSLALFVVSLSPSLSPSSSLGIPSRLDHQRGSKRGGGGAFNSPLSVGVPKAPSQGAQDGMEGWWYFAVFFAACLVKEVNVRERDRCREYAIDSFLHCNFLVAYGIYVILRRPRRLRGFSSAGYSTRALLAVRDTVHES